MRLILLIITITTGLLATAQSEAEFKAKVQSILKEFETNFSKIFGDPIPSSNTNISQTFQPGLLRSVDEIWISSDTVLSYVSTVFIKADSSIVRKKIDSLNNLLQVSLGDKFERTEIEYFFNQFLPEPALYKSGNLEVALRFGKFNPTSYIIAIAFRKRFRTKNQN